jgi:hypothetical protein
MVSSRRTLRRVALGAALTATLVLAPLAPPAVAQRAGVDPTAAEAQALFRRGVELGEQDRWAEALEHFRRSREIAPRPNTVFNVAFALGRLGRLAQAVEAFDEYLALTEGETSERRDEALRLRGEALASLAELELELSPPDARVWVDGDLREGAGSPRSLALDPGRHVVRATAEGHEEGVLTVSVLSGERSQRSLALRPLETPERDPSPPPPPGRSIVEEPLFWVIAGALVVGAGVGLGVGVAASQPGAAPPSGGSSGVVLEALRF